jgi:hypothetical protein
MNNEKIAKIYEITEVIRDAVIVYRDNTKEFFDAIRITDKGVIIGKIFEIGKKERVCGNCRDVFVECGFIPGENIMGIKDGVRKKICKKKS